MLIGTKSVPITQGNNMKFVMNCLDEDQTIVVGGKHFSFKGRQIKPFYNDEIAGFILREKSDLGFVEIPKIENSDEGQMDAYDTTEAGKKDIEALRRVGINNYCARLSKFVYNAQVSLRKDLEQTNNKIDPRVLATDGDLRNLEQLAKYRLKKEDSENVKVEKIKALEKQLEKI